MLAAPTDGAATSTTSLQNKHLERVKTADGHSRTRTSSVGSKSSITQRTGADLMTEAEERKLKNQLSSPFARQDIFYTGSVTSLHEYKTSRDMTAYVKVIYLSRQMC